MHVFPSPRSLPRCLAAWLPRCLVAWLPCCLVASLPLSLVASFPCCLAAPLPDCLVSSLPRMFAAWPLSLGVRDRHFRWRNLLPQRLVREFLLAPTAAGIPFRIRPLLRARRAALCRRSADARNRDHPRRGARLAILEILARGQRLQNL